MSTNLNVAPYYDDFDETKGFQQIVFKPGYAVQARELTQMQSIIKDQIAKFGNHIFTQGQIVIPGNISSEMSVDFIRIPAASFSADYNMVGETIVHSTLGFHAIIKYVDRTDTNYIKLFIAYTKGAGVERSEFAEGDTCYFLRLPSIAPIITNGVGSIGKGALANIRAGVYFINGHFVYTPDQTCVIQATTNFPSGKVVFKIKEEILSADQDETLLDPAQGSYNFSAPGADRLAVTLELTTIDYSAAITDDYIELIRLNNGVVEFNRRNSTYSELSKEFARRTYLESGNYIANGLNVSVHEHLKTKYNTGVYVDGDQDKFAIKIDAGTAFINGFEVQNSYTRTLSAGKSTSFSGKSINRPIQYGQYVIVNSMRNIPDIRTRETLSFYDTAASSGGTLLGTAIAYCVDYHAGDSTTEFGQYKIYISEQTVYDMHAVGSIRFGTGGFAKVLHEFNFRNISGIPAVSDIYQSVIDTVTYGAVIQSYDRNTATAYVQKNGATPLCPNGAFMTSTVGQKTVTVANTQTNFFTSVNAALIFPVSESPIKSLKTLNTDNTDGPYNIEYVVTKYVKIPLGSSTVSISDGEFLPIEVGGFFAFDSAGPIQNSEFVLTSPNTIQYGNPGAVTATATIHIAASVEKVLTPKTKTLQTHSISVTEASYTDSISLGKADVFRIVQITSSSGRDVRASFQLDSGQRDQYYGVGKLDLHGQKPVGDLNIVVEYFTHSGSGDFFCIDSYTTLGVNYRYMLQQYRSSTTSLIYDLTNCIDFRPRTNDAGTFQTGASLSDAPNNQTFFQTFTQHFYNRIDSVVMTQNGQILIKEGTSKEVPKLRDMSDSEIVLAYLVVPADCRNADLIYVHNSRQRGYKMSDISKLERRLEQIETFATISGAEKDLLTYEILDENGLSRFKSGYLVDNFQNPFTVCDYSNPMNNVSFAKFKVQAAREQVQAHFQILENSTNYAITDGVLTLPYTEVPMITQNTSSRVHNVNPFMVFDWVGSMTVNPAIDNWVETETLPTINNTVNTEVLTSRTEMVEVQAFIPVAPPAPVTWDPPVWEEPAVPVPAPPPPPPPPPRMVGLDIWQRDIGVMNATAGANPRNGIVELQVTTQQAAQWNNLTANVVTNPTVDPVAWLATVIAQNNLADVNAGGIRDDARNNAASFAREALIGAGINTAELMAPVVAAAEARVVAAGLDVVTLGLRDTL